MKAMYLMEDAYINLRKELVKVITVEDADSATIWRYWFYEDGTAEYSHRGTGEGCFWTECEEWDRTYSETIALWK